MNISDRPPPLPRQTAEGSIGTTSFNADYVMNPLRGLNVVFFPTPGSMLFWDMCVLWGYLILNCLCGWVILTAERKQVADSVKALKALTEVK